MRESSPDIMMQSPGPRAKANAIALDLEKNDVRFVNFQGRLFGDQIFRNLHPDFPIVLDCARVKGDIAGLQGKLREVHSLDGRVGRDLIREILHARLHDFVPQLFRDVLSGHNTDQHGECLVGRGILVDALGNGNGAQVRIFSDDGGDILFGIEERAGLIERAAAEDFCARLDGVADEGLDLLDRRLVDQRADRGAGFHAWANGELVDCLDEGRREAVVNVGLHQDAIGADASLAGIAVFGGHGTGHRLAEICVVENDERRVAAELEGELLHRVGALPVEHLADCGRAGEGELAHPATSQNTLPTAAASLVVTMLSTPGGTPASSASLAMAKAQSGVSAAGLTTMVHPAASAGATLRVLLKGFDRWRGQLEQDGHVTTVATLLDESGYTEMWRQDKSAEAPGRLENLKELVRALADFETLPGFLDHVSLVMENEENAEADRVSLMTLHAAKGLEFDTVFLPGWEEGLFPNQRAMDENGAKGLEEERRLAYVGITRAPPPRHRQPRRQPPHLRQLAEQHPQPLPRRTARRACRAHRLARRCERDRRIAAPTMFPGQFPMLARRAKVIEAWEQPARAPREDAIEVGARVFHQKFGYGTVTAADDDRLDIDFDNSGSKRVLDRFVERA